MQTEGNIVDIQRVPLSSLRFRRQVETFLAANGLRLEQVDDYYCIISEEGLIEAGAGIAGNVIKCVAVDSSERSRGLLSPLISHVISQASVQGRSNLKVFTKPVNEEIFTSLGFHTIARAPLAILMENGHGLEDYLASLSGAVAAVSNPSGLSVSGSAGVIVMNANPFTLGHRYLVEKASEQVGKLFVIPVKEDVSLFPYDERLEMISLGCEGLATVLEGSDYQISAATFPTYFLKDLSEASETQMLLDLDLFGGHIAPALGATVRFVGTEPSDPLTARYNELMKEVLPSYGIQVVELPRLKGIQASEVRDALERGSIKTAAAMTPATTWPYLVAELMARALRIELDTPLKPGLVDKDSNGAHSDMDYALMKGSIDVIRRSFIRHLPILPRRWSTAYEDTATLGTLRGGTGAERSEASGGAERSEASERRYSTTVEEMKRVPEFGKAIEEDVLEYTGGVNTYRGAIFALGLASIVALEIARDSQLAEYQHNRQMCLVNNNQAGLANILIDSPLHITAKELSDRIADLSGLIATGNDSHGARAVKKYGVKGALQLAREGYKPLFEDWLPFYRLAVATGLRQTDVQDPVAAGHRQTDVRSAGAAGLRPYSAAAERGWTRPCPGGTADKAPDGTADKTQDASQLLQKTLLRIMSTLDDTCVIHRVGYQRAQEVKKEAKALLDDFSEDQLREMKQRYDSEGISPGGAADMLALTILIDSLTQ
ncbi:MAG: [Bacteroidales bacterium]|nr:[citrate (pro-3S)-lyase] ligase [Bacteroidales bacterium]